MATTTTNFGWDIPQSTDLVKDGATAIAALGQDIDTAFIDLKGGTTDQVLAKASGTDLDFSWTTPTSGGMTLLTTLTLTGATVSYTSISQSYKDLVLVTRNFRPASNGQNMLIRLNQDSGANRHLTRDTGVEANNVAFNVTSIQILNNANSGVAGQAFGIATINDYTNTATWKYVNSFAVTNDATTSTNATYSTKQGAYNQTSAITSFDLITSSGNFTSGSVLVYGVK